jgi:hypothetical protein
MFEIAISSRLEEYAKESGPVWKSRDVQRYLVGVVIANLEVLGSASLVVLMMLDLRRAID